MNPVVLIGVVAVLLSALTTFFVMRIRRLALALSDSRTELDDCTAQLDLIFGRKFVHAFTWDVAAGRIRPSKETSPADGTTQTQRVTDLLELMHPEDAARVRSEFEAIRAGRSSVLLEEVRYRGDTQSGWSSYVVSARAIRDRRNSLSQLRGLAIDMSRFREAQEQANRSEHRFRELAEAMPQIVYVANADGTIAYVNARWTAHTGLTTASMDEMHHAVHPDDLQSLQAAWAVARRDGTELMSELRLKSAGQGTYRWFLTRALPSRDESGAVVRWYGTSTDIDDVRSAQLALEASGRRKDEFLATLAHELRNPLAPIRNAVTVLQLSKTQTELPWALGVVDRQLRQMTRLIDDLMDVSRITEGKLELQLARVDLRQAVRDGIEMCSELTGCRSLGVEVEEPDDPVEITADAVRLSQIVANLVNNAIKYSDTGTLIRVRVSATETTASVSVRDDGIGLAPDQLGIIFNMFTQVPDTARRAKGGLGIGLSLVHRLVALHRGSVHAESAGIGHGSTFVVTLPLEQRETSSLMPEATSDQGTHSLRVLLVDDNIDAVESLGALLELRGATVRTVLNGLDVLAAASEFGPDAIVLDIGLPGADGYEVCRMIRREPWGRSLPLIAVTGWGHAQDRDLALAAGFDRHLTKPSHPDEIMRTIIELHAPA